MGKGKIISLNDIVSKSEIDEYEFFSSLIKICYKYKLVKEERLEIIGYERIEMLKTVLTYYTRNESSSVREEDAENILENIDYIVSIYLREQPNMERTIERLNNDSVEFMFSEGRKIIKDKFNKCKSLLSYIQDNKIKCSNFSYNDTIDDGISIFFKSYNDLFNAHEAPCSVDYALSKDVNNYRGILYIEKYLSYLKIENEFCSKFDNENINKLLSSYDENYELLIINIFEIVLTNALGLVLCGKLPYSLNISKEDMKIIENKFKKLSCEKIEEELLKCSRKLIKMLDIKDNKIIIYINEAINKISLSVYASIDINTIQNIFISFKKYEAKMQYFDKERMSDKKFRKVTEYIRNCSSVNEKITCINNNMKSIVDLNDMLCAECLFDDEYTKYFKSISIMEKVLLSKFVDESNEKKEWIEYFFRCLSDDEKKKINYLKQKIEFNY